MGINEQRLGGWLGGCCEKVVHRGVRQRVILLGSSKVFHGGCLAFRGFFFLVNFESFVEEGTTRVEVFGE